MIFFSTISFKMHTLWLADSSENIEICLVILKENIRMVIFSYRALLKLLKQSKTRMWQWVSYVFELGCHTICWNWIHTRTQAFFIALSHGHFTFSHAHFNLWGRKMKMRMRESDEKMLALLVWIQLHRDIVHAKLYSHRGHFWIKWGFEAWMAGRNCSSRGALKI